MGRTAQTLTCFCWKPNQILPALLESWAMTGGLSSVVLVAAIFFGTANAQTALRYLDVGPRGRTCCMAADSQGNIYVAGEISTPNDDTLTSPTTVVVTKLDASFSVQYRFTFTVHGAAAPNAIAVDDQGQTVVGGWTGAADFPLVSPLADMPAAGPQSGFIFELNATGTRLRFSTLLGAGQTSVDAVAISRDGELVVAGDTDSRNFPVTRNAFQKEMGISNYPGLRYGFVTRIDTTWFPQIAFSTYLGGSQTNCSRSSCTGFSASTVPSSIAVTPDGAVLIGGSTTASDFPVTPVNFSTGCGCSYRMPGGFLTELSPDLSALRWSTYLGGHGFSLMGVNMGDAVISLSLSSDGSITAAGTTASSDFPVAPAAFETTRPFVPFPSMFVARLDSSGQNLLWSTFAGDFDVSGTSLGAMALDAEGNVWLTGVSASPDVPLLPETPRLGDTFAIALSADGTHIVESRTAPAVGKSILLDGNGNTVLLGSTGTLLRLPAAGSPGVAVFGLDSAAAPASVVGEVAPGEIISLYGTELGPAASADALTEATTGKLPAALGGSHLTFDGVEAPLLYASSNQVNAIVPFAVSGKLSTNVQLISESGKSESFVLNVVPAAPAIFNDGFGAIALNEDGTLNSVSNPAMPGSVVTVWASGAGVFTPPLSEGAFLGGPPLPAPALPVSVLIAGMPTPAEIVYAGAAPYSVAGLLQVSFRLPANAPPGVEIALGVGPAVSTYRAIAVQRVP